MKYTVLEDMAQICGANHALTLAEPRPMALCLRWPIPDINTHEQFIFVHRHLSEIVRY